MTKAKNAPKTKTKPPTTAKNGERPVTEAEAQKIIGRNAGKSGALFHTALTARLLASFAPGGTLSRPDITDGLKEASDALVAGNPEIVERMLYAQMTTLNAVFAQCVSRATTNMGEYLGATEAYMRLGLKAQAQCARTAEVLGNLRSGPAIFAKQANVTSGPQQINNGPMPQAGTAPRAQETANPANELLEHTHGERLDTRAAGTAGKANPAVETVEAVDRAANARGQGKGSGQ